MLNGRASWNLSGVRVIFITEGFGLFRQEIRARITTFSGVAGFFYAWPRVRRINRDNNLRLLLARHGEIGRSGRYFGATDLPISRNGRRQAGELAAKIAPLAPDICLCSPMLRTRQTAEIIGASTHCDTVYMDELREIDFGRWEKLTFKEIAASYPEQAGQWAAAPLDFTFPQGENTGEFFKRIDKVAAELSRQVAATILLVTHGGVVSALLCHFLGLPFDKGLLFRVRPAGLVTLEVFARLGVLTGFNI